MKNRKFNYWKFIQITGIFLVILGIIFALASFKVSMLLYFGIVSILIGAINILVYYIFIGTSLHWKNKNYKMIKK